LHLGRETARERAVGGIIFRGELRKNPNDTHTALESSSARGSPKVLAGGGNHHFEKDSLGKRGKNIKSRKILLYSA